MENPTLTWSFLVVHAWGSGSKLKYGAGHKIVLSMPYQCFDWQSEWFSVLWHDGKKISSAHIDYNIRKWCEWKWRCCSQWCWCWHSPRDIVTTRRLDDDNDDAVKNLMTVTLVASTGQRQRQRSDNDDSCDDFRMMMSKSVLRSESVWATSLDECCEASRWSAWGWHMDDTRLRT